MPSNGAEVYKTTNGGTKTKTHTGFIDDFFYSYGYYFSSISVDPSNADKIYLSGYRLSNQMMEENI
jgi:hypothetical protein